MEKAQSFGINGGPKLPIGYRFRPTDEELVVHYLKKKALSLPLPASVIPDFDVLDIDPFALPGDVREKRYFFYKKKKSDSIFGDVNKRIGCCSGYWKPVGKGRLIVGSDHPNDAVGLRRTMAFCQGRRFRDTNTRWLLHEYHLVRSGPTPNSLHLICPIEANEYWVVCAVFQKKRRLTRKKKNNKRMSNNNKPCDVVEDLLNSGPTMSSSSVVTDDDDNDNNKEDNTSVVNVRNL